MITSVALNAESDRAVDVAWSPGFDGNSPVKKFIVQFRLVPSGQSVLLLFASILSRSFSVLQHIMSRYWDVIGTKVEPAQLHGTEGKNVVG